MKRIVCSRGFATRFSTTFFEAFVRTQRRMGGRRGIRDPSAGVAGGERGPRGTAWRPPFRARTFINAFLHHSRKGANHDQASPVSQLAVVGVSHRRLSSFSSAGCVDVTRSAVSRCSCIGGYTRLLQQQSPIQSRKGEPK